MGGGQPRRPLVPRRPRPRPAGGPGLPAVPDRGRRATGSGGRARTPCPEDLDPQAMLVAPMRPAGRAPGAAPGAARPRWCRCGGGRWMGVDGPDAAGRAGTSCVVQVGDAASWPRRWPGTARTSSSWHPPDLRDGVVRRLHGPRWPAQTGGTGEPATGGTADVRQSGRVHGAGATTHGDRPALAAAGDGAVAAAPPGRRRWRRRPGTSTITSEQLVKDLELLFVCGTPGHLPDDLIEAEWESGEVYLDNADTISRPLRLAPDEAVALLVGLRTLAERSRPARPRRGRVGAGQALGGGRRRAAGRRPRRWRSTSAWAERRRSLRTAREALAGAAPAAAALPGAVPRRDHRARRRPDAGHERRRPLVPGGAGATGPRTSGCSGSTGSSGSRCSRRRRDPAAGGGLARDDGGDRPLHSRPATSRSSRSRSSRARAGWPSTTRSESVEELPGGRLRVRLRVGEPALAAAAGAAARRRRPDRRPTGARRRRRPSRSARRRR